MEQNQIPNARLVPTTLVVRFYLFLRERDARLVELFFLLLNTYILALVVLPPNNNPESLLIRIVFQLAVVVLNLLALIQPKKIFRIISALSNTMILSFISFALVRNSSPHAGTYILLALLASFACWKITAR